MTPPSKAVVIRRAILDELAAIGGTHNHDALAVILKSKGHPVSRDEVAEQMRWLAEHGMMAVSELGVFVLGDITMRGRDIADGSVTFEGISPFKSAI